MLRGSKRLVEEQASQASLWSWRRDLLRPRHLHLLLWNYSYLLQRALCGWVECAWGNTSWTPPGASPSELFQSLILVIIMEPNSPKKIQFAVPLFQSQIAPEAAEQVGEIGWGAIPVYKVIQTYILINWKLLYLEFVWLCDFPRYMIEK